jgi:hypothetical protein
MNGNLAVFGLFLLILAINKTFLYDNLIGRLISICIVIYASYVDITYGMLVAFIIITISSKHAFVFEGMENKSDTEKKDKNSLPTTTSKEQALDPNLFHNEGIDKEDIKLSIASVDSNTIPVDKQTMSSTENVEPFYSGKT